MSHYFTALDIGPREITAIVAQWLKNGDYKLEGYFRTESIGFSGGTVTDIAKATDSMRDILNKLKKETGSRVQDVYTGVSSPSIKIVPSSGALLLSKYGKGISENDIKKGAQIASTIKMPIDREPLHRIVRGFSIDGEKEIKNPLNLEGVKLEINMNVLTINSSILRNISKCISDAGFTPAGFVFSGLASAYRVLTEEDKLSGVALLNISKDAVEVVIFCHGTLESCRVFSSGKDDSFFDSGSINSASLEKITSQINLLPGWKKINKIVVIGEGVLADDLIEAIERFFELPVAVGAPLIKPLEDLPPERINYISSLGILDYLQEEKGRHRRAGNILKRGFNRALAFVDKYF